MNTPAENQEVVQPTPHPPSHVPHVQPKALMRTALPRLKALAARPAFVWLLTVSGSALIGVVINHWWTGPRPEVELSSLELTALTAEDESLTVPLHIRELQADHFYLEKLEPRTSYKQVREFMHQAKERDAQFTRIAERVESLIALLRTRPATLAVADRRQEFLRAWFAGGDGKLIDEFVKSMLAATEDRLPIAYRVPRPITHTRMVTLEPGNVIYMGEIDELEQAKSESDVRGRVNVYDRVLMDAHETNLLRRTWEFLEPEVFVPILEGVKNHINTEIRDSRQIQVELEAAIAAARPEHLRATVVVTNRGGRPLAVRNVGVLLVRLPPQAGGRESIVAVDLTSAIRKPVTVVDAGKVEVIELQSIKAAEQLARDYSELRGNDAKVTATTAETQSPSRLRLLFDAGSLDASVVLARVGGPTEQIRLPVAAFRPVGEKGDDVVLTALKAGEKIAEANVLPSR